MAIVKAGRKAAGILLLSLWIGLLVAGFQSPGIALAASSCDNGDPNETNSNPADACPVAPSGSISGQNIHNVCPAQDEDYFTFFLNNGVGITIVLTPGAGETGFQMELRNPSNSVVGSGTSINYTTTSGGNFSLRILNPCKAGETDALHSYSLNMATITADSYEENDSAGAAREVSATSSTGLTIAPANDPDHFFFNGYPGPATISVSSSSGIPLKLTAAEYGGGVLGQTTSTSPSLSLTLPGFNGYQVSIEPQGGGVGNYTLSISNQSVQRAPDLTPTFSPTPTLTGTPDLGGTSDLAEPNNNFGSAFRIAAGNIISLNFNAGPFGVQDIDYFVMNVKQGVSYSCYTSNLGLGTDTILAIYGPSPDTANLLGLNDDINTGQGYLNSLVSWDADYEGQVYVVVSQNGSLSTPGAATYELVCQTGGPPPILQTALNSAGGSGTASGGSGGAAAVPPGNVINLELIGTPSPAANQPTESPQGTLIVNIVVGYDGNANGILDLSEGVEGMSVRAINARNNRQIGSGFTDVFGSVQIILTEELNTTILVVIPFLNLGKSFRVGTNAEWRILLPPGNLPGLIP